MSSSNESSVRRRTRRGAGGPFLCGCSLACTAACWFPKSTWFLPPPCPMLEKLGFGSAVAAPGTADAVGFTSGKLACEKRNDSPAGAVTGRVPVPLRVSLLRVLACLAQPVEAQVASTRYCGICGSWDPLPGVLQRKLLCFKWDGHPRSDLVTLGSHIGLFMHTGPYDCDQLAFRCGLQAEPQSHLH